MLCHRRDQSRDMKIAADDLMSTDQRLRQRVLRILECQPE